jgi:hypothetical protein
MIRQGDILLKRIDGVDTKKALGRLVRQEKEFKDALVGLGEESGHKHVVRNAELYVSVSNLETLQNWRVGRAPTPPIVWVVAGEATELAHVDENDQPTTDHKPLVVPAGVYEVVRQQEFDPFNQRDRSVID